MNIRSSKAYVATAALCNAGLLVFAWFVSPIEWGKPQPFQPIYHAVNIEQLYASAQTPIVVQGVPVRIVIDQLAIDLPVQWGSYNESDGSWTLGIDAYFASLSTPINNTRGTTLIYGHNNAAVFGPLLHAPDDTRVAVYTDTNYVFSYRLVERHTTSPDDISLFSYDGPATLTLQTCSGVWSENRTLMTFRLEGYRPV